MRNEFLAQMYLKINHADASPELMNALIELVVDTSIHLPDMFTIHIHDPNLTWVDDPLFKIGAEVEISGQAAVESSPTPLIKQGEITSIEPEMLEDLTATLLIRGYDKLHRLHWGKKTRTFLKATDTTIINKIVSEAGLSASVDYTSEQYEHVFQDCQTDIEFLRDIAKRNGFFLYCRDGRLYFTKEPSIAGSGPELKWGDNLLSFQARFTSSEQVQDAEVHGWDVNNKRAIIGKSTSPTGTPTVNSVSHGGTAVKSAFGGSRREIIDDHPVYTQKEAEIFAQSILNDRCHAFFEAEGTCLGNPQVRAGDGVNIKGVGSRFSSAYRVTRAIHRYNISGYITEFEISGQRPNTLAQLLAQPTKNPYGVVIGIVTNVNDPESLGRVKVKFPTISDQLESNWARLATPMAGPQRGIEFIPEVNDEVLVAFEHDDINKAYILGGLWNGKDKPPETTSNLVASGKVKKRIIKSRSGHVITLDDSDGEEKISIIDKTGKNSIEIDSKTNALTIKTEGKINIETKDDVKIKGKNIAFEATANVDVNAKSNATVKATSNINIEATAKATVKANAGIDINASGPTNIKGAIINLN
jgi:phage protein D/phage baseplate assembly protein gpV